MSFRFLRQIKVSSKHYNNIIRLKKYSVRDPLCDVINSA